MVPNYLVFPFICILEICVFHWFEPTVFIFIKGFLFIFNLFYLCGCMHVCMHLWTSEECTRSPELGVTSRCEPPEWMLGTEKQPQVFWKTSQQELFTSKLCLYPSVCFLVNFQIIRSLSINTKPSHSHSKAQALCSVLFLTTVPRVGG